MSQRRASGKRGLRELLDVGATRSQPPVPKLVTVVFDVHSSAGDYVGLAMHTHTGRPIYVDPPSLQGAEVMHPMIIQSTPNPRCLAAALSRALQTELSR